MLAGGSAYGLAAADGAMRWLEEHGRGYATPGGLVPIVPAAVIYDLAEGDPRARPDADAGYAACEAALPRTAGARPGRRRHRRRGRQAPRSRARRRPRASATPASVTGTGATVAALAVVNAFGDVIGEDGKVLAGPRVAGEPAVATRGGDRRDAGAAGLDRRWRSETRRSSA